MSMKSCDNCHTEEAVSGINWYGYGFCSTRCKAIFAAARRKLRKQERMAQNKEVSKNDRVEERFGMVD